MMNVDIAKTLGDNILEKMIDKNLLQHTFKKKNHDVCSAVKINQ